MTSAISTDLTDRLHRAADYVNTHGWTQRTEKDDAGRVCLTGAVRYCSPEVGDFYLIRAILQQRDHAEGWNDAGGRTAAEVLGYLRSTEVTDDDLAETFGPQWSEIVALVRRAAGLTKAEVGALAAAKVAAWNAPKVVAWVAAAWAAAKAAAGAAAGDAAGDAAWAAAWAATGDAAWAAATRDLIGQHGYTQQHYDTLAGPWASVIGPVHPDDTSPERAENGEQHG